MTDELAMTLNEAKAQLALWIEQERAEYAGPKWEDQNRTLQEEIVQTGQWANHVFSYVKRAEGMTLSTLQGRQQLGKVITSATSLLEHAMMIYGDMPRPGVSSTDGALPWDREPAHGVSRSERVCSKCGCVASDELSDCDSEFHAWALRGPHKLPECASPTNDPAHCPNQTCYRTLFCAATI